MVNTYLSFKIAYNLIIFFFNDSYLSEIGKK